MVEWAVAFLVFLLVFAGLALGVLLGRRGIEGSCGGLNNIPGLKSDCGGSCRAACKSRRPAGNWDSDC